MDISLIVPNRNNLRYFKWMYASVRKHQGDHTVWICSAADACTDGTVEYYEELSKQDPYFKYIVNSGPQRKGHTELYDRIVNEIVETEIAMIFHSDMYLCPGALDAIERHMYEYDLPFPDVETGMGVRRIDKTIVSLTRIEPPLHPPGPEKILADFGMEPEDFKEDKFLDWFNNVGFHEHYIQNNEHKQIRDTGTSTGIFAPWAFWVNEFKDIGGHSQLFAPQSKEDSDIFNRFKLNNTQFIQTWSGFVYHMTCRGSRRNTYDGAPNIQTNNPEWEAQNLRSTRNFIRIWGTMVQHNEYLDPIIPPKYNIGIVFKNSMLVLLQELEPFCDNIYIDNTRLKEEYISIEQKNTVFDLNKRIHDLTDIKDNIIVHIDGNRFNQNDFLNLVHLSEIIKESGEIGSFELGTVFIEIKSLDTYEHDLVNSNNTYLQDKFLPDFKNSIFQ